MQYYYFFCNYFLFLYVKDYGYYRTLIRENAIKYAQRWKESIPFSSTADSNIVDCKVADEGEITWALGMRVRLGIGGVISKVSVDLA